MALTLVSWNVNGARERNIGWRIDYFFVAAEVLPRVAGAFIWPEVRGSDHCPVGMKLASKADGP